MLEIIKQLLKIHMSTFHFDKGNGAVQCNFKILLFTGELERYFYKHFMMSIF